MNDLKIKLKAYLDDNLIQDKPNKRGLFNKIRIKCLLTEYC